MCFFLNYTIAGMDVAWMPVAWVKELVINALKDLPLTQIEFAFWVVGKAAWVHGCVVGKSALNLRQCAIAAVSSTK